VGFERKEKLTAREGKEFVMTYDHFVNASLLLAGFAICWLVKDPICQTLELGRYRRRPTCITRKVWDSEEPKDL
jgi:hypothetical protein